MVWLRKGRAGNDSWEVLTATLASTLSGAKLTIPTLAQVVEAANAIDIAATTNAESASNQAQQQADLDPESKDDS